jgi:hypothetical protein
MTRHKSLFIPTSRTFKSEYETLDGELIAIRDGKKSMSVFEWSTVTPDIELLRSCLSLGLLAICKQVEQPSRSGERYCRVYVTNPPDSWRVPAYELLASIPSKDGYMISWSEELELFESMLLGYTDSQIEQWATSRRLLGVGRHGDPIYLILSDSQRRAISATGDRCLPVEMCGDAIEIVLVRRGIAPAEHAEDLLLQELLTIARIWVSKSLHEKIRGEDQFDDNAIIEKSFVLDDVAAFNRGIIDQIEFFEDGWPHRELEDDPT